MRQCISLLLMTISDNLNSMLYILIIGLLDYSLRNFTLIITMCVHVYMKNTERIYWLYSLSYNKMTCRSLNMSKKSLITKINWNYLNRECQKKSFLFKFYISNIKLVSLSERFMFIFDSLLLLLCYSRYYGWE